MENILEALEIERDVLRDETKSWTISTWKFWQNKKDRELIRKLERICEINSILKGARIQRDSHLKRKARIIPQTKRRVRSNGR